MVDEDTCNTVATQAIPPCMVQEDTAGKEACMQRTAKAIAKEVGPVMKDCRCQAFNKIKDELLSASELVCAAERDGKQWLRGRHSRPSGRLIWWKFALCRVSFNCRWFTGIRHNFNR